MTFTPSASAYAAAYVRRKAGLVLGCILPPVIAAAIAGLFDMRWWFVGLMLLFIVLPMALSMAWFTLIAKPEMAVRLRPQKWNFTPDGGAEIEFYRFPATDDTEDTFVLADTFSFTPSDITDIVEEGNNTRFCLHKGSRFDILLIPTPLCPPAINSLYDDTL